ncbi:MAG: sigma-70 family RNA polymerase sigma factor, partial [Pseudomonadales bacterium]|nr:sigma-70 family RNA polymerase sigma factor [Pseudomonadales bacterium]
VNAKKWDPGKAKLSTWLHRIAHNLCIDLLRKQQRVLLGDRFDEELDSNSNFDNSLRNAVVELAKEEPSSQQTIEKDSELSALNLAISKLPETQRSALLLCCYQGFSNKEAADITGLSVRALESLIARAKRSLRTQMEAHYNER